VKCQVSNFHTVGYSNLDKDQSVKHEHRAITPKLGKAVLRWLCTALLLNEIYKCNYLQSFLLISPVILELCSKCKQAAPQCDETRFSTIQPSSDVTGIRNERWQ